MCNMNNHTLHNPLFGEYTGRGVDLEPKLTRYTYVILSLEISSKIW